MVVFDFFLCLFFCVYLAGVQDSNTCMAGVAASLCILFCCFVQLLGVLFFISSECTVIAFFSSIISLCLIVSLSLT